MLYLVLHCICWLIAAILIKKQSCQRSGLHFQKSVQLVERNQKYMAAQCQSQLNVRYNDHADMLIMELNLWSLQ